MSLHAAATGRSVLPCSTGARVVQLDLLARAVRYLAVKYLRFIGSAKNSPSRRLACRRGRRREMRRRRQEVVVASQSRYSLARGLLEVTNFLRIVAR